MYKYLLCLRYLRTRYLAFVCIVSIMLGVATLIVVNSVMSGFSQKLKDRLLGTSADITVATMFFGGFEQPPEVLTRRLIDSEPGQYIEAVAPSVDVVGTIQFEYAGRNIVKPVKIMGVDPAQQVRVGNFQQYVTHQKDKPVPSFELPAAALERMERLRQFYAAQLPEPPVPVPSSGGSEFLGPGPMPLNQPPPMPTIPQPDLPPIERPKPIGIIVGHSIAHFAHKNSAGQAVEKTALHIGDTVMVATLSADDMRPVWSTYVVVDYFKSEMSEYDSQFIYLPLEEVQRLRHMGRRVTSLQVKLKENAPKDYAFVKPNIVLPLQQVMGGPESGTYVMAWQDTQGPLLAAIDIERGILNLLLFMIVGVAGFSILAIFTMIVSEKYRDIGILKALGASHGGVMGIFVWYAVFLGVVGCTFGAVAGLGITRYINEIEAWITRATGQQLFDRSVYYFEKIPTNVEPLTVILVIAGAMIVAVLSSLIPAVRAARLRPIQALRFE